MFSLCVCCLGLYAEVGGRGRRDRKEPKISSIRGGVPGLVVLRERFLDNLYVDCMCTGELGKICRDVGLESAIFICKLILFTPNSWEFSHFSPS